jgi:PAS domain S-box-containing protein
MFGYTAGEMIGQSITRLIPADRLNEEAGVPARIRRGESIDHFDTVRRHRDGTLVPVALAVSPVRAPGGSSAGVSKVARDMTERQLDGQALAAFDREVPDVALTDLATPDEDGYDLIRSIRERPVGSGGAVPAIAMIASVRAQGAKQSLSSGFQFHLAKPIDPASLFSAVERLTAKRSHRP